MSAIKHTAAPWTLETVRTSIGICHKIGPFPWKDGKENHACVYVDYPGDGAIEAELLANAKLIAAAPELLEALQAVVSVADRATVEFDKARAAIAKAIGA